MQPHTTIPKMYSTPNIATYYTGIGWCMPLPADRVLTVGMLKATGACSEQIALFREVFGSKVYVSQRALRKAQDAGLPITWFGEHFSVNPDAFALEENILYHDYIHTDMTDEEVNTKLVQLVYKHVVTNQNSAVEIQ
jgi:hypothetical protein